LSQVTHLRNSVNTFLKKFFHP